MVTDERWVPQPGGVWACRRDDGNVLVIELCVLSGMLQEAVGVLRWRWRWQTVHVPQQTSGMAETGEVEGYV